MRILLDTDVLSELMKPRPEPRVEGWMAKRRAALFICSVSKAEIEYGVAVLPAGRKKTELAKDAAEVFAKFRCLSFETKDCRHYANIRAEGKRAGRPFSGGGMMADAMIAAIARRRGMTLATRNTRHFRGVDGLNIVNPWR